MRGIACRIDDEIRLIKRVEEKDEKQTKWYDAESKTFAFFTEKNSSTAPIPEHIERNGLPEVF